MFYQWCYVPTMAQQLELSVDSTCISSGYCRRTVEGVFAADAAMRSFVVSNPVPHSPDLQDALEGCPVEAISAVDVATGETVFPED